MKVEIIDNIGVSGGYHVVISGLMSEVDYKKIAK